MEITNKLIQDIAALAKLEFDEQSAEQMKADLEKIIGFVDKLSEIDTEGVDPLIYLSEEVNVPIDTFVSRGIELLNSIPRLLLIITITSVVERSIWIVMVIIGVTSWTGIARFTRAEFLRIRSLEFVQAAESLGFSSIRTIKAFSILSLL